MYYIFMASFVKSGEMFIWPYCTRGKSIIHNVLTSVCKYDNCFGVISDRVGINKPLLSILVVYSVRNWSSSINQTLYMFPNVFPLPSCILTQFRHYCLQWRHLCAYYSYFKVISEGWCKVEAGCDSLKLFADFRKFCSFYSSYKFAFPGQFAYCRNLL